MDFRTRMRALRAVQGISQKGLAEQTGIPNTYLSDIETGKSFPNPEWEARIRAALGWTPEVDAALEALGAALAEEGPSADSGQAGEAVAVEADAVRAVAESEVA